MFFTILRKFTSHSAGFKPLVKIIKQKQISHLGHSKENFKTLHYHFSKWSAERTMNNLQSRAWHNLPSECSVFTSWKIRTAIFDFYSSVRLGRKGNLYQGGKQWPKGKRGEGWGKRNYPTPLPTLPTLTLAGQKTDCELVMLTCPSKMPPLQATQWIALTTLGTNLHESLMLLLYFFL